MKHIRRIYKGFPPHIFFATIILPLFGGCYMAGTLYGLGNVIEAYATWISTGVLVFTHMGFGIAFMDRN